MSSRDRAAALSRSSRSTRANQPLNFAHGRKGIPSHQPGRTPRVGSDESTSRACRSPKAATITLGGTAATAAVGLSRLGEQAAAVAQRRRAPGCIR
jgi:hypothetical protein